jgi:hypothetical protein
MPNVDIFIFGIDQAQINTVQTFCYSVKWLHNQPYPHPPTSHPASLSLIGLLPLLWQVEVFLY